MRTARRCVLEGERLGTVAAVYDALEAQLGLPAHFGRNLDALWDALTTDVPGPIEIVWRGSAASRAALGPEFDRVLDVLRAAEAARKDLTVTLA
jgi:ribonuclease inhibitor